MARATGQPVTAGYDQDAAVQRDRGPGGEVGLVDGKPVDQYLDVAAAHSGVRVCGIDFVQAHLAIGVAGLERIDEPVERGPVGGLGEPDAASVKTAGGPATIVLVREVMPGHEQAFEAILRELAAEARAFPGHQGLTVLRPQPAGRASYTIVAHFATGQDMDAWCQR
jgi:hypothetical protein